MLPFALKAGTIGKLELKSNFDIFILCGLKSIFIFSGKHPPNVEWPNGSEHRGFFHNPWPKHQCGFP